MTLPSRLPLSVLRAFLHSEASGGLVLMASAALALVVANSPWADTYFAGAEGLPRPALSVLHWINDGLMAVFFLLVGLEIKREMLDGQPAHLARPHPARRRRPRRHGGPGPRLRRRQLVIARDAARLGHSGRHRHRLRARRAGAAGLARAGLAQDLPDGAGHHRRPRRRPHHRRLLHRRPVAADARRRGGRRSPSCSA